MDCIQKIFDPPDDSLKLNLNALSNYCMTKSVHKLSHMPQCWVNDVFQPDILITLIFEKKKKTSQIWLNEDEKIKFFSDIMLNY